VSEILTFRHSRVGGKVNSGKPYDPS